MAHHNALVAQLNEYADRPAGTLIPPADVLSAFCHTADLSNVALQWHLAEPWSARVGAEATNEFNEMQRIGLPLQAYAKLEPYTTEELAARQIVFSDGWVRPLYAAAARLFPGARDRVAVLHENREACKTIHKEAVKKRLRAKMRVVMHFKKASTFRDAITAAQTAVVAAEHSREQADGRGADAVSPLPIAAESPAEVEAGGEPGKAAPTPLSAASEAERARAIEAVAGEATAVAGEATSHESLRDAGEQEPMAVAEAASQSATEEAADGVRAQPVSVAVTEEAADGVCAQPPSVAVTETEEATEEREDASDWMEGAMVAASAPGAPGAPDAAANGAVADVARGPASDAVSTEGGVATEGGVGAEDLMTLPLPSFEKRREKERDVGASVGEDVLKASSPRSPASVIPV